MDRIEEAADQLSRPAAVMSARPVKALIVANAFLETDLEKLKAAASMG
ncbi:hypothetical protein [Afipia sp. GAS231]|nr:hypothetical protein [Afipia sp. GAS231]SDO34147.1 hypothetical protein SAMN05444050_3897 [Afipia sp. GAS231]